jgi:hypothetical protein
MKLTSRLIVPVMDDALPMGTGQDVFYFTEGAVACAGYYLHAEDNPLHTHSFVEIAFAVSGAGTHRSPLVAHNWVLTAHQNGWPNTWRGSTAATA